MTQAGDWFLCRLFHVTLRSTQSRELLSPFAQSFLERLLACRPRGLSKSEPVAAGADPSSAISAVTLIPPTQAFLFLSYSAPAAALTALGCRAIHLPLVQGSGQ